MSESKVLSSFDFGAKGEGFAKKYNWSELLDGQIRQVDFDPKTNPMPKHFAFQVRLNARKKGMGVKTKLIRSGTGKDAKPVAIVMQAYKLTPEQMNDLDSKRAQRAAAKKEKEATEAKPTGGTTPPAAPKANPTNGPATTPAAPAPAKAKAK